jgi:methylmalonyl-CoA mutase N-terminal domain/subunit
MKRQTDYGYEIKSVYTPEDVADFNYTRDLGDPGVFPYTRGYYPQGYRSRMWTQRMTAGLGSSCSTNEVLKQYREMGQTGGMCVISDRVFSSCIDPDHPLGEKEAGILGWPGSSLLEFEELMDEIPLTGQSITLLGSCAPTPMRLAYVVALARKRGIDIAQVHGSVMESPFENYFGQTDVSPFDQNLKLFLDACEYVLRNKIRMRACIISQHFQESGGNNAQAIAVELSMLKEVCGLLVNERGLDFDLVSNLPYELVSVGTRFFEEAAKIRALRRMWAHLVRNEFNSDKCHLLITVHTSGRTMTYQQPLNNIARCAIQTLAGVVSGCSALDNATLDNAHSEPSELAARMSLNTQHIVAHESGAADVVDPLAGSYFVETLTNKIEEEAYKIYNEIQSHGGMIAALKKGYIQEMLSNEASKRFREIETKERLVVGVNHLAISPEDDFALSIKEIHANDSRAIAERMAAWKRTRDQGALTRAIRTLYQNAKKGDRFNLMPSIIEAVSVYATAGETIGVIRKARGLAYDPFNVIECPFELA